MVHETVTQRGGWRPAREKSNSGVSTGGCKKNYKKNYNSHVKQSFAYLKDSSFAKETGGACMTGLHCLGAHKKRKTHVCAVDLKPAGHVRNLGLDKTIRGR